MPANFRFSLVFFLLLFLFPANYFPQNFFKSFPVLKSKNSFDYENPATIEKQRRIAEIIEEMREMREHFLETGDFIDIFPTVYYHVTNIEIEMIRAGQFKNPHEIMSLMQLFYDSYAANRRAFLANGIDAVEPHWREYYTQAIDANARRKKSPYPLKSFEMLWAIKKILHVGFRGHIVYDLPRAVRKVCENADEESIYADFRVSDKTMNKAAKLAVRDISHTIFPQTRGFAAFVLNSGRNLFFVMRNINRMRVRAWQNGTSKSPNLSPQQSVLSFPSTADAKFSQSL